MKYYIIAGEASGDLHGSNLMKALYKNDVNAQIRFWGGNLMSAAGGELVVHYKDRAFMGFIEVLFNLRKILGFIKKCKYDIQAFQPDALIFIDNSGFNLRIAKWAKPLGYATHYYISPQVWASRASRVQSIKVSVDHMYTILPFVQDFYAQYDYKVQFVGHPLLDAIADRPPTDIKAFAKKYNLTDQPIIALLPGSRKQEIKSMLSVMLSVVPYYPEFQFIIAGAPSQERSFYQSFIKNNSQVTLIGNETYAVLSLAHAALVTSGTATLETALFKVPQVVCYKGNWVSYTIAKRIITLAHISLVNLVMNRPVVVELIQKEFNPNRLKKELDAILDKKIRDTMFSDYYELEKKLGGTGASQKTAQAIVDSLGDK